MEVRDIARLSLIAVAVLIGVGVLYTWGTYNSLVSMDEGITAQWQQVEVQYQRRMDLVPQLVETVKGVAVQEQTVFLEVAEIRSQWQGSYDTSGLEEADKIAVTSINKLLAVVENYPELKSSENFLALQAQLEGTERRIMVQRNTYNAQVKEYNSRIRQFPASLVARAGGLEQHKYFEAVSDEAPKINFK